MTEHIGRRSVLKGLAASPLLLAGCASRGSSTAAGTLNIGQISNSVAFFPLFIAENQGFFSEEGVKVGARPRLGTGAKVAAALKSGSIDIGAGVITDAFNLAQTDSGTRIVSSLVTEYYVDIIAGSSLGVPAEAPIEKKINALVGKRIGITGPGSGTEALVKYLFGQIGKDAGAEATLVNLGSAATSAVGALKSGRVDALSFFQPIGQQAEAVGAGRILISPARGDVPSMRGALHGVVFSTTELLGRKKKEVAGFTRAMGRALEVIHGDEARVRKLLGQYLDKSDPTALDALLPILRREVPDSPKVQQQAYRTAKTFHLDSGLVDKAPDYGEVTRA
jgi:ABC-type nitrate/sulfonate/bicarbonate transport system substrate-binding protein